MIRRFLSILVALAAACQCGIVSAQSEPNDTTASIADRPVMTVPAGAFDGTFDFDETGPTTVPEPVTLSPHLEPPASLKVNPSAVAFPRFSYIPGTSIIRQWETGGLFATGSAESLPGLMGIERGSLNATQRFGAVTVTLYAAAAKYGYFRGLSTTYGFGGSASWQISPTVSLTVFGSYWTPASLHGSPGMLADVAVTNIGGYIDWRFHPHWGVKAGVQSYRSMVYGGRWETQPIVMPYYRTSSGAEIGVDFGGILYQLVRGLSSDSNWGRPGNPTIEPPRPQPLVRPRN